MIKRKIVKFMVITFNIGVNVIGIPEFVTHKGVLSSIRTESADAYNGKIKKNK
jgi:hypothetical protein